ncbi:MAG: glycosyltransferase family 2 protein [Pontiella sp.]
MIPITVVIPVKNEEKNLPRCLALLRDFSEVLVVDSSSTDATRSIAEQHGAQVVDFKWNGKFPKKRNWVLRNVELKNEWVLFLDADEYVSSEFCEEVQRITKNSTCDGFWITYHNFFMGRKLKHGDPMRKLALFRKGRGEYEKIEEDSWSHLDMEVHEHPLINGPVGSIAVPVEHHDYKGYEAYVTRHNAYSTWEAQRYLALRKMGFYELTGRQKIKYRLMGSWLLGPIYFIGSYIFKMGFLDGKAGWILAKNKHIYFFQIKCKIDELKSREGVQVN